MSLNEWLEIGTFAVYVIALVILWLCARGYIKGRYAHIIRDLAYTAFEATEEHFRREPLVSTLPANERAEKKRQKFRQKLKAASGGRIRLKSGDFVAAQAVADEIHHRRKVCRQENPPST